MKHCPTGGGKGGALSCQLSPISCSPSYVMSSGSVVQVTPNAPKNTDRMAAEPRACHSICVLVLWAYMSAAQLIYGNLARSSAPVMHGSWLGSVVPINIDFTIYNGMIPCIYITEHEPGTWK